MKTQRVFLHTVWLVAAIAVFASADLSAQKTIQGEKLDPSVYGPVIVESMQAAIERDKAVPRPLPPDPKERNGRQGDWKVPTLGATTSPHSGRHYAINEWGDTMTVIARSDTANGGGDFLVVSSIMVVDFTPGEVYDVGGGTAPMPEPSAALMFAIGGLVLSSGMRSRRR